MLIIKIESNKIENMYYTVSQTQFYSALKFLPKYAFDFIVKSQYLTKGLF